MIVVGRSFFRLLHGFPSNRILFFEFLNSSVRLRISVKDTNDHVPVFSRPWYTFDVNEGWFTLVAHCKSNNIILKGISITLKKTLLPVDTEDFSKNLIIVKQSFSRSVVVCH